MTHMPGHIFYRTGDYQRAQVAFDLSTSVDEAYMRSQHVSADDDWNYVHNLMYSIANLLEEGQIAKAGEVSTKLINARGTRAATLYPWSTRDSISRLNPELPVALRNGDWPRVQTLLADAHPPATLPNLQALATALTTFAKGMASISQKHVEAAQQHSIELDAQLWHISQQLDQQQAAAKSKPKDDNASATPTNQVTPTDQNLEMMLKNLAIMSLELRGAILIPSGKVPEAEALFAQARKAEFDLGYREPPAFVQPVAELEAEYLTAAKQTAEAEKAWKQALADRPNSGYPLYGLAILSEQSSDANKTTAAYSQFLHAWKTADPQLPQIQHAQQWMMAHPDKALASASETPQSFNK
jgi:tetratricopeptide (TPR) repeat protein